MKFCGECGTRFKDAIHISSAVIINVCEECNQKYTSHITSNTQEVVIISIKLSKSEHDIFVAEKIENINKEILGSTHTLTMQEFNEILDMVRGTQPLVRKEVENTKKFIFESFYKLGITKDFILSKWTDMNITSALKSVLVARDKLYDGDILGCSDVDIIRILVGITHKEYFLQYTTHWSNSHKEIEVVRKYKTIPNLDMSIK